MTEILASLSDINAFLPENVQINNAVDDSLQIDAFRLIRGQLVTIFTSEELTTWATPETTPELIRSIASRLIASKYYARLVSGNIVDTTLPAYASGLYTEALNLLTGIKNGTSTVVDSDGNPLTQDSIGSDSTADVYPTDTSVPGPQFTMDRVLLS